MKTIQTILLMIPLLITPSCTNINPPTETPSNHNTPPQVTFLDPELHDQIILGNIAITRDPSNLLHVEVPIRSTAGLITLIDYRMIFLDQNNTPLNASPQWMPTTLHPAKFQTLQETSSTTRAANFYIDIRYAR